MNRTERLHALIEVLRATAPRPRSARWLADRFQVSTRTVERDIASLQRGGTEIHAEAGRSGGYVLDNARSLAPVVLSPSEALAVVTGLRALNDGPLAEPAATALNKVLAVLPDRHDSAS